MSPASLRWDTAQLEAAIGFARKNGTSALLITHAGSIVVEKYWKVAPRKLLSPYRVMQYDSLADGQAVEDVASMQKSIVALLAEVAVEKDLLDYDRSVTSYLGSGWSDAPVQDEARINVRHLMSMTSGLSVKGEFVAPAGTKWQYNTNMYAKMVDVLEAATGKDIGEITKAWLTGPLGMAHSEWRFRKWSILARDANSVGFVTTARDLTRVGVMMLANGKWQGASIVKDISPFTRASQSLNPNYALLWWLNTPADDQPPRAPAAPDNMYSALGALGRDLFVLPGQQITVVRLGDRPAKGFARQFWQLLSKAIPATQP